MTSSKVITTYVLILVLTIAALFIIKVFDISYPVSVRTVEKTQDLAVVGEGKIEVVPDLANIDVGIVVTNASSIASARESMTNTNNKIIESMQKLNIKNSDIKTTAFSITPNYVFENNRNRIEGYNGNARVSIKVRDTKLASKVIEEAALSGANEVYTAQFTVEDPAKYREEARNKAIQNAKDQAEKLAGSLGIKLGKVTNIVEASPDTPPIFGKEVMAVDGRGGGAVIEPGSQTITSTVTLFFEKR